jgi:hypothetical protein
MDPHSIGRLDPDPEGLKRAKMKRKKAAKRQKIRHKKYKNNCNWYKNVNCDFIFLKGIVSPDWKGLQIISLDRFEV